MAALKDNINLKLDADSFRELNKISKKLKVRMSTLVRMLVQRAIEDDLTEFDDRGFLSLRIPNDLPKTQRILNKRRMG